MTPTQFIHQQAGHPSGKHDTEPGSGPCMICGACVDGALAVPAKRIIKSTTVGDSQLFRFRQADYFCEACAWLMEIGKGQPGNFIAGGGTFERAVISLESVVADKRPWIEIIHDITVLPSDTTVTGVLTTDVKIRLWHRCQMATIGQFGLYIHAPDYDTSEWRALDLTRLIDQIEQLRDIMLTGYTKRSIYHGLHTDYKRLSTDPQTAIEHESWLADVRRSEEFLPALLMTGITNYERKQHVNTARHTDTTATERGENHPDQLGLF